MSDAIDKICGNLKQHLIDGIFPDEFVMLDLDSPYEAHDVLEHLMMVVREDGMPYIIGCNGLQVFVYSSDRGVMLPEEIAEIIQRNQPYPNRCSPMFGDVHEPIPRFFIDNCTQ